MLWQIPISLNYTKELKFQISKIDVGLFGLECLLVMKLQIFSSKKNLFNNSLPKLLN